MGNTTKIKPHSFPFEITIRDKIEEEISKRLIIESFEKTVKRFRKNVIIQQSGKESDQLTTSLVHQNTIISSEYLNSLNSAFDYDGIEDRQLEYKRTIDFVITRSQILKNELDLIESRKKNFKKNNNLIDISSDASVNIEQKFIYDAELFEARSQKDLIKLLKDVLSQEDTNLIPANIGINNAVLNELISEYNKILINRNKLAQSAGENNQIMKNLDNQIINLKTNISNTIKSFELNINTSIENLEKKEVEFAQFYGNLPDSEKILRSINRELEIKEALFLLLLQKKEEAGINLAVVKPSIKLIDSARSDNVPVSPRIPITYLAFTIFSLILPTSLLYLWFLFDDKIHTREQLNGLIPTIPIIGEIPSISDTNTLNSIINSQTRNPLAESFRMLTANLNYSNVTKEVNERNKVILVTSSIKGEGKTICSVNLSSSLSSKNKRVLLIGTDLRNPQIHKFLNVDKEKVGLSNYIYKENIDWKNILLKHNEFDILLSGSIPPNPSELLNSSKFNQLIDEAKIYDHIVIDSAPACWFLILWKLLVMLTLPYIVSLTLVIKIYQAL